jgi:hypothetical protein
MTEHVLERRWHGLSAAARQLAVGLALAALGLAAQPAGDLDLAPARTAAKPAALAQGQAPADPELARLTALLDAPGPDGRAGRELAVQRLVQWPDPAGHAPLQRWLAATDDPDHLRLRILDALHAHLLGAPLAPFGGAAEAPRRQILAGYLRAVAPLWRDLRNDDGPGNPLRAAARLGLQSMPGRDLQAVLATVLDEPEVRLAVLRCLADLQQVHLARLAAPYLEATEPTLRSAAQQCLQLLTFHDVPFSTRAQFDAWFEQFGSTRYVDLAERAARRQPLLLERLRDERRRLIVDAAVEFVRAHTTRTPGLAWAAIGARTLVDDPAVLDACLEQLQQALADRLPGDGDPASRQAFCTGLLQRFRAAPVEQVRRRALLLEVAAYCVRADEPELAGEVVAALQQQLGQPTVEARLAALRGLRRFPSVETRTRLVAHGNLLAQAPAAAKAELDLVLAILGSRTAPRWFAPGDGDADRVGWLQLVRTTCAIADVPELRSRGLELALSLDGKDQRVAEVFELLLQLAVDPNVAGEFRGTCLIHLRGWLDQATVADTLVARLQQLLADPVPEVRQKAAEALLRLPELTDSRRVDWLAATIAAVRDRLPTEPSAAVLQALANLMQVCGRQKDLADRAIGALRIALAELPNPVPEEQRGRLEALLLALSTVAADANAARGPWLGACPQLLEHGKRSSLRLILQSHAAIELAKDVAASDGALRERAQRAMQVVIQTALQKPANQKWGDSDDLLREAREVRTAFGALDPLDEAVRLDLPEHRLLRLEVEVATGKFLEAAQRAQGWLAAAPQPGRPARTPAQTLAMRSLAAEALLGLNKPADAARLLAERDPEVQAPPGLFDLKLRIARALLASNPRDAAALFERVYRGTPTTELAFRARLVEWAQATLRADPAAKDAVLAEVEPHAALFAARDCPQELKDAFAALRGTK